MCRTITLRIDAGLDQGARIALPEFNLKHDTKPIRISPGDKVILGYEASNTYYFFDDRDRRPQMSWLAVLFVVVVLALGRLRGGLALTGIAATLIVLIAFAAPSVLDGNNPVLVAVMTAALIAFTGLNLTHGPVRTPQQPSPTRWCRSASPWGCVADAGSVGGPTEMSVGRIRPGVSRQVVYPSPPQEHIFQSD